MATLAEEMGQHSKKKKKMNPEKDKKEECASLSVSYPFEIKKKAALCSQLRAELQHSQ